MATTTTDLPGDSKCRTDWLTFRLLSPLSGTPSITESTRITLDQVHLVLTVTTTTTTFCCVVS